MVCISSAIYKFKWSHSIRLREKKIFSSSFRFHYKIKWRRNGNSITNTNSIYNLMTNERDHLVRTGSFMNQSARVRLIHWLEQRSHRILLIWNINTRRSNTISFNHFFFYFFVFFFSFLFFLQAIISLILTRRTESIFLFFWFFVCRLHILLYSTFELISIWWFSITIWFVASETHSFWSILIAKMLKFSEELSIIFSSSWHSPVYFSKKKIKNQLHSTKKI